MAPKKAAKKKAAKEAAKKHPGRDETGLEAGGKKAGHGEKRHGAKKLHREAKDLRRAYEHLGRLSALEKALTGRTVNQIKTITNLAQNSLLEDAESAADLLRAAEHLAFASLAQTSRATRLSEALEAALNAELEHLSEKAAEHWKKREDERPAEIADLYASMLALAETSRLKGAYRRALEFARGAEALAHVRRAESDDAAMLERAAALKLANEND